MAKRCKRHNCECSKCGKDLSKEDNVICVRSNYKWTASYCKKCWDEKTSMKEVK